MQARLIIISSPSGGGKTSVIERLLQKHPNMVHSISCTTRPPRASEVNGRYYHHVDRQTFKDGISAGRFAEWNEVHDNLYGTPREPLDKWLSEGKDVLLDLDVIGGLKLKEIYSERAISIFILPPSQEELERRLMKRATDSAEVQQVRLKNALAELSYKDRFDYRIINDDLEKAVAEVEKILC